MYTQLKRGNEIFEVETTDDATSLRICWFGEKKGKEFNEHQNFSLYWAAVDMTRVYRTALRENLFTKEHIQGHILSYRRREDIVYEYLKEVGFDRRSQHYKPRKKVRIVTKRRKSVFERLADY